jgi:hypothetical protein
MEALNAVEQPNIVHCRILENKQVSPLNRGGKNSTL